MKDQDDQKKKPKTQPGLRLTPRDLKAIQFLLDQKFASRDQLYRAVWKTEYSRSSKYVWDRLNLLQIHGLIRPVRVHTRGAFYYLATKQGALALETSRPSEMTFLPLKKINYQEFEHDSCVTECRIALENLGLVSQWRSEKRLLREKLSNGEFSDWESYQLSQRGRLPDAVFCFKNDQNQAFELELAPKKKARYREKILDYVQDIELCRVDFSSVLYVTCSNRVFSTLTELTRDFQPLFQVVRYQKIIKEEVE